MPWTNQGGGGGGGWQGGGNRGPWSQGPSGGGNSGQPPDLDELLRRGRERLSRFFPHGVGGAGFVLAVLVLAGLWLLSGLYVVREGQQGVETRFGAFTKLTSQGLNYHLPYPIENKTVLAVAAQNTTDIGQNGQNTQESLMLTGDENIVNVSFDVVWDIKSAPDFLFNIRFPQDSTVKAVAESAMREIVGQNPLDLILTKDRAQIGGEAKELIQRILDEYGAGIRVREVRMQPVSPPDEVNAAFQDVQAARADRDKYINQANTYANQVIPAARGQAAKIQQDADAYRQQAVAEAQGDAQRFLSVLGQYRGAKDVTRKRLYIETMERVLGNTSKVIMDDKSSRGVLPYLPLPGPAAKSDGEGR